MNKQTNNITIEEISEEDVKELPPEDLKKFQNKYQELVKEFQKTYPTLEAPPAFLFRDLKMKQFGKYDCRYKILLVALSKYLCAPRLLEHTILHELIHAYLDQRGTQCIDQWHGHLFWSTFKPLNKYLLAADKYRERFKQKMEELKHGQIDYTDRDLRVREINIPKQITRHGGNLSGRHS